MRTGFVGAAVVAAALSLTGLNGTAASVSDPVLADVVVADGTARGRDWRAWRGDGSGVSSTNGLPVSWGPEENIRWRTPIPGDGISSPIVLGDRVYVTTAVVDTPIVSEGTVLLVCGAFLVLGFFCAFSRRRRRDDANPPGRGTRLVLRFDGLVTWLALTACAAGFIAMFTVDALIIPGNFGRTWRVTGAVGMLGLIAAAGLLDPRTVWRLFALGLLAVAAVLYHQKAPAGYTEPIPFRELFMTSGPLALAAVWSLLLHLAVPCVPSVRNGVAILGAVALVGVAVLQFAYPNYLKPDAGLQRSVVCLDRATGEVRWRKSGFSARSDKKYHTNSYATPTPVTDGETIVASFGPGLFAMDLDGNVRWRHMEPDYTRFQRYGAASSPIIVGDRVIYMFMPEWPGDVAEAGALDYEKNGHLTALDKKTGEVIWRVKPPRSRDSYGTPRVVRIGGRTAVVIVTWQRCSAFDVTDGSRIWTCDVPIDQCVPSPLLDDDTVYVIGGAHGPTAAVAIRLEGTGDVTKSNVRWTVKRAIPQCPSPVLYDGLIYMVTDGGVATCLDAKDGAVVWKSRLKNRYRAALLAGDGKVYFIGVDGETTIVRAGRTFEVIGKSTIGEEVFASPAIADRDLLIRSRQTLFCIKPPGD